MTKFFTPRPPLLPPQSLVTVVALQPLPGSPGYGGDDNAIIERAIDDILNYRRVGVDAILLENSYDLPYIRPPLPDAAIALLERLIRQARRRFDGPMGLQLLEAANETALQLAAQGSLDFIRVEGYVYAHVGGAGLIEACAGELLRLRKQLRAERLHILADVKKKHCAHALTGDLSLAEVVRQCAFFRADGVIVTGPHTGFPPTVEDLQAAREASALPLWIGSGLCSENLSDLAPLADASIVGSTLRQEGDYLKALDPGRLQRFVETYRKATRDDA